jgi:hypothetical protein
MVHVVAALPPPDGQAAAEIGHEHGNEAIGLEVAGDGAVRGVVRSEHDLVPEQSQEEGRRHVPAVAQGYHGCREEDRVAGHLLGVREVRAIVEALIADSLVQRPVLLSDILLYLRVQRRIFGVVVFDLLLLDPVRVGGGISREDLLAGGRRVIGNPPDILRLLYRVCARGFECRSRGRWGRGLFLVKATPDRRRLVGPDSRWFPAYPKGLHGLPRGWDMVRLDLVRRIFPNHVQDCQPPARMLLNPRVQLQDKVFENDNYMTVGD